MTTAAERLKLARKAKGWNQVQLAEKAGVATGTIGNIEAGTRGIKASALKLARALDVDPNWLDTGEGEMVARPTHTDHHLAQSQAATPAQAVAIDLDNNPDWPAVRRVSVKAQAGITGYAVETVDDLPPIVFRADWYKAHGYRPARMLALRVTGESMIPSLWPGDLIVVNTECTTPKDGVAALVAYYGEVTVKRLQMDAGQWWLTSDNPDQRRHARKLCDENTVIVGEVVYKQSERV